MYRRTCLTPLLVAASVAVLPLQAATINNAGSGTWDDPATWSGGVAPGPSDFAVFGTDSTIVTVDNATDTAENMQLNAVGTLIDAAGAGALNMAAPSSGSVIGVGNTGANIEIAAPLNFAAVESGVNSGLLFNISGGAGDVTLSGPVTLGGSAGNSFAITELRLGGGQLNVTGDIGGTVTGGTAGSRLDFRFGTDGGRLTLSGNNTFTTDRPIFYFNTASTPMASRLELASNNALGGNALDVGQNGTVANPNDSYQILTTVDSTIANDINLRNDAGTMVVGSDHATGTSTYSGTISLVRSGGSSIAQPVTFATQQAGATTRFTGLIQDLSRGSENVAERPVLIAGPGTVEFASANTYSENTTVTSGTFLITNSTGSGVGDGDVFVDTGATLGGTGRADGAATVAAGGVLQVGLDHGMAGATATSLTFFDGITTDGTTLIDLIAPSVAEQLITDGLFTAGGSLQVADPNGIVFTDGQIYDLVDADSFAGSFSSVVLPTLSGGLSWDTSSLLVDGSIAVVPEPASLLLVAAGGALTLTRSRRTRDTG
jgi:autotransporter-associated beta strand protein